MMDRHILESKIIILNRFAELICKTIGEINSTKIEVVDFHNFIVVKGITSSNDILDLNKLKENFIEKFRTESKDFKIGNTIDLIEYGVDLEKFSKCSFEFRNSINLKSSNCIDEFMISPLVYKSEFPYGYSYNQGKSFYYYARHIVYNLQTKYSWDKITMSIPLKNFEEEFEIFVDSCDTTNENLKSAILDSFEFNYTSFNKKLDESDWWVSIAEASDPTVVKTLNEDFVIF